MNFFFGNGQLIFDELSWRRTLVHQNIVEPGEIKDYFIVYDLYPCGQKEDYKPQRQQPVEKNVEEGMICIPLS